MSKVQAPTNKDIFQALQIIRAEALQIYLASKDRYRVLLW